MPLMCKVHRVNPLRYPETKKKLHSTHWTNGSNLLNVFVLWRRQTLLSFIIRVFPTLLKAWGLNPAEGRGGNWGERGVVWRNNRQQIFGWHLRNLGHHLFCSERSLSNANRRFRQPSRNILCKKRGVRSGALVASRTYGVKRMTNISRCRKINQLFCLESLLVERFFVLYGIRMQNVPPNTLSTPPKGKTWFLVLV